MGLLRPFAPAYRAAAVAGGASLALHGAALLGLSAPQGAEVSLEAPVYLATLEAAAIVEPSTAPPAAVAKPRARPRPRPSAPRPGEAIAFLPAAVEADDLPAALDEPAAAMPELLALAEPIAPLAPPAPAPFRADALPGEVSIAYTLSSAFADGEAEYTWKREGDRYEITGTAQAVGFFTLFLEGRIEQSTTGRVTDSGLRPERFVERRGATPEEGLAFDWEARRVEFRRGDLTRTGELTDETVDWLSMIFQLAHRPPAGESMALRVYTQRRLYQYRLEIVGTETLELPFGPAATVHLRHTGAKPEETVDVWLGIDQHYLPVKLRYPVARNRLVVEQTATAVRAR